MRQFLSNHFTRFPFPPPRRTRLGVSPMWTPGPDRRLLGVAVVVANFHAAIHRRLE